MYRRHGHVKDPTAVGNFTKVSPPVTGTNYSSVVWVVRLSSSESFPKVKWCVAWLLLSHARILGEMFDELSSAYAAPPPPLFFFF